MVKPTIQLIPLYLLIFSLLPFSMPSLTSSHSASLSSSLCRQFSKFYSLLDPTTPSSPSFSSLETTKWSCAVIFDARRSSTRVHVFCFNRHLTLVPIGNSDNLQFFVQTKPGLSGYAQNPKAAAQSLFLLLDQAQKHIPEELRPISLVKLGTSVGQRLFQSNNTSFLVWQEVRDLLKERSTLKFEADWVNISDGTQEAVYQWVTINYILGNLGKKFSNTVGVINLGSGSVQMVYAISKRAAAEAPSGGNDSYVRKMHLQGTTYYLYVYSYLHYGLLAARAEILKTTNSDNPCILAGFQGNKSLVYVPLGVCGRLGSYIYGGVSYPALAFASGSNLNKCERLAIKALKVDEQCMHVSCTFGGVWSGGGGGAGQNNLYLASYFFERAAEAGIIDPRVPAAIVRPTDFHDAAKRACKTNLKDAKHTYPHVEDGNLPYICMDFVYLFRLLVDGFGLDPRQEIAVVEKLHYNSSLIEVGRPLGSAIDAVSSAAQASF